jgi:hypothetical protein
VVAAHDVNGSGERLGDIAVHVERGGENASRLNEFADPAYDLALGVVEVRRLEGAVKGEEDCVQRQVRLDRRREELPVRLEDFRRGGAAALGTEGRAKHDLGPLRRRLEDLDHPADRAFDAPQPVANLAGLEKPTASPMVEP